MARGSSVVYLGEPLAAFRSDDVNAEKHSIT